MNKKSLLIIAVSVLVIALIGITYLLFTEKQSNRELIEEFALEKEDLENEYTRFAQQYDELKLTVSNDSLSILWNKSKSRPNGCSKNCVPLKSATPLKYAA